MMLTPDDLMTLAFIFAVLAILACAFVPNDPTPGDADHDQSRWT
jgi:hypothetical protein